MPGAPRRLSRVAAYALCTSGDALLLCRITPGVTGGWDGMWTLPGGGVDFGEHPRDAVLRELAEETGLSGEVVGLLEVDSATGRFHDVRDGVETEHHTVRVLYRVRVTGGELRDEPDGTTDACRWVPAAALAELPLLPVALLGARLAGLAL